MKNATRKADQPALAQTDAAEPIDSPQARRQRRLALLQPAEGLWKDRDDIPKDGVEYQRQLRSEWR